MAAASRQERGKAFGSRAVGSRDGDFEGTEKLSVGGADLQNVTQSFAGAVGSGRQHP